VSSLSFPNSPPVAPPVPIKTKMNEDFEDMAENVDFLNILNSKLLRKSEKTKILNRVKKGQIKKLSRLLFNTLNGGLATARPKTMELLNEKKNLKTVLFLIDPDVSIEKKKQKLICHPEKFRPWSGALMTDLQAAVHDDLSPKEESTGSGEED